SSSFHSNLLPLFLEKKVSTFMLLGQSVFYILKNECPTSFKNNPKFVVRKSEGRIQDSKSS
ncbi:hypothetical protein, partial [Leptospira interrogans]